MTHDKFAPLLIHIGASHLGAIWSSERAFNLHIVAILHKHGSNELLLLVAHPHRHKLLARPLIGELSVVHRDPLTLKAIVGGIHYAHILSAAIGNNALYGEVVA